MYYIIDNSNSSTSSSAMYGNVHILYPISNKMNNLRRKEITNKSIESKKKNHKICERWREAKRKSDNGGKPNQPRGRGGQQHQWYWQWF